MSFDIHGNPLRHGHCEVHPHVHEVYPCSVCLAEKPRNQSLRPSTDYDPLLEISVLTGQRDELLTVLEALAECYCEAGNELSRAERLHHHAVYRDALCLVAKHKGSTT